MRDTNKTLINMCKLYVYGLQWHISDE